MLITNFDKKEEPIYREAVRRFGRKELYVDKNAYVGYGVLDEYSSALRCKVVNIDLTRFWKIFDEVRNEMWCISFTVVNETMYLCWQKPFLEEDGYFWTCKDIVKECLNENTPEHPFIFHTRREAIDFLKSRNFSQKCKVMKFE